MRKQPNEPRVRVWKSPLGKSWVINVRLEVSEEDWKRTLARSDTENEVVADIDAALRARFRELEAGGVHD